MSRYTVRDLPHAHPATTSADERTDDAPALHDDPPAEADWIARSFVLSQNKPGPVYVPAPVAGYVHRLGTHGGIEIRGDGDAAPLARVLRMDPHSFAVREGGYVAYGQPLGRQWGAGADNRKTATDQVRIELATAQAQRYFADLAAGAITPERYPDQEQALRELRNAQAEDPYAITHLPDAAALEALAESGALTREDLRELSPRELRRLLRLLGYLGADGQRSGAALEAATRAALLAFQAEHGLTADAVPGPQTIDALRKAEKQPLLSNPDHPDHALYKQALDGLEKLDPGTFKSAEERRNAAAMLAVEARTQGLREIEHVTLEAGGAAFVAQGVCADGSARRVEAERPRAERTAIEKSTAEIERLRQLEQLRQLEMERRWQIQMQQQERDRQRGLFRR